MSSYSLMLRNELQGRNSNWYHASKVYPIYQSGKNKDKAWLNGPVAMVKGKLRLSSDGPRGGEAWARLGADGPRQL